MEYKQVLEALRRDLSTCQSRLKQSVAENQRLAALVDHHLGFLDHALDGYFFTNERDEILFTNRMFLRLLGYDEAEQPLLLGAPLGEQHWVHQGDRVQLLEELQRHGSVRDRKVEFRSRQGTSLLCDLSAIVTRNGTGQLAGIQYTVRALPSANQSTTAELRAENRALAALTAIGQSLLSNMNVEEVAQHLIAQVLELFQVELAWIYLHEQDGAYRMVAETGLAESEVERLREAGQEFIAVIEAAGERDLYLFSPATQIPLALQAARSLAITNLIIVPLRAHEKMVGFLAIASRAQQQLAEKDWQLLERIAHYTALAISNALLYDDLQGAYEELKRAQEQLVEAERQKVVVEMAGAAAHELNQPLTVLLGYSNLLKRTVKEDDPQKMLLDKIEHSTRKISEVVARLGKIARYRTREYVEGEPIVDIEAASRPESGDEPGG